MQDQPGYNLAPSDVFGTQVDTSFWDQVLSAGRGPTARARADALAGLRSITSMGVDIAIRRLPETRGQTVMAEGRTVQTGFFLPGYE